MCMGMCLSVRMCTTYLPESVAAKRCHQIFWNLGFMHLCATEPTFYARTLGTLNCWVLSPALNFKDFIKYCKVFLNTKVNISKINSPFRSCYLRLSKAKANTERSQAQNLIAYIITFVLGKLTGERESSRPLGRGYCECEVSANKSFITGVTKVLWN